jgi:D-alanine-D-alanine ligase-like ATP-grasp enzyme
MSERKFHQYFGPSQRHDRACVELSFALGEATHRLAPLEPALLEAGFKLREVLPDESLPLDEAVCRLASAILARHAHWWSSYGSEDGRGWAAIGFPYPDVAAAALVCAIGLLVPEQAPPAFPARLRELSSWLANVSKIKMWLLAAAAIGGRDTTILNLDAEIYQVGQGAKGVQFYRAGSQRDSITGIMLEGSKQTTVDTLHKLGLPTTTGMLVRSSEEAVRAARKLGLPCVVKPLSLNRGNGVAAGLASDADVEAAANAVLKLAPPPLRVEKHVEGDAHRLLVAADELLWSYRKRPASVTGDGSATIAELIDRENLRRSKIRSGTDAYLFPVAKNEALERFIAARYGMGIGDVLPKGTSIDLAAQANTAAGGSLEDMMSVTHPDNRALAIRAARVFRLEVIGIDFITPDISRSWKDVPCAILEVNRMPSMNALGDAMLVHRTLFPNRLSGAIPTVAVIGDEDYRESAAEALRAAFADRGLRLAMAQYGPRRGTPGRVLASAAPPAIETLLLDPEADAAAVLCDPARIDGDGLPLRRCDLLVRQDDAPPGWLEAASETVLRGKVSQAKIDHAVARLARQYGDPAEGGPLPALEPLESGANEFRLTVWRTRGMPRVWFWERVGAAAPRTGGLTIHEDLLAAVHALAAKEVGKLPAFEHGELLGGWARTSIEATLALPKKDPEKARAALRAAVERINAVVALKA